MDIQMESRVGQAMWEGARTFHLPIAPAPQLLCVFTNPEAP